MQHFSFSMVLTLQGIEKSLLIGEVSAITRHLMVLES